METEKPESTTKAHISVPTRRKTDRLPSDFDMGEIRENIAQLMEESRTRPGRIRQIIREAAREAVVMMESKYREPLQYLVILEEREERREEWNRFVSQYIGWIPTTLAAILVIVAADAVLHIGNGTTQESAIVLLFCAVIVMGVHVYFARHRPKTPAKSLSPAKERWVRRVTRQLEAAGTFDSSVPAYGEDHETPSDAGTL